MVIGHSGSRIVARRAHTPAPMGSIAALIALLLGGCQTVGIESGGAARPVLGYNLLFDQGDHLRELIGKGDLQSANTVYADNQQFFNESQTKNAALLTEFAARINDRFAARLTVSLSSLENVKGVDREELWSGDKNAIATASNLLDEYDGFVIVRGQPYRAPEADALKTKIDAITTDFEREAVSAFSNYSKLTNANFFEAYPIKPAQDRVFAAAMPALSTRLQRSKSSDVLAFAQIYGKKVRDEEVGAAVGRAFLTSWLREQGHSADPAAFVDAAEALRAAGVSTQRASADVAGIILINGNGERSADFELAVDDALPVSVQKLSARSITEQRIGPVEYALVIRVNRAQINRKITDQSRHQSTYLAGYRSEHNAAFDIAKLHVVTAQSNLNSVRLQNAIDGQTPQPSAAGAILSGLARGLSEGTAQNELRNAIEELRSTPPTIQREVFANYEYVTTQVEDRRIADVDLFVVRKGAKAQRFNRLLDEEKTFNIVYQLHDKDPARRRILSSAETEDGMTRWEKEPLRISLSRLVANISRSKAEEVSIASIGMPVTASAGSPVVTSGSTLPVQPFGSEARRTHDHRFSSVVIVANPKGSLGSGFFVRPDVVLTNWHVVQGAGFAGITTFDGQNVTGKVIASDVRLDLALLRVSIKGHPVEFPKTNNVELGTSVEAIGHPKGYTFSITRGVISGFRSLPSHNAGGKDVAFLQTDTPLSPGNSGGPLFRGNEVVGVATWARVDKGSQNLNFAVDFREVLNFIRDNL